MHAESAAHGVLRTALALPVWQGCCARLIAPPVWRGCCARQLLLTAGAASLAGWVDTCRVGPQKVATVGGFTPRYTDRRLIYNSSLVPGARGIQGHLAKCR